MTEHVQKFASRFQLTLAFFIVMLVLLLLAYRSEVNNTHIRSNIYLQCVANNRAASGTNAVLDAIIEVNETAPTITEEERAIRVEGYRDVKVPLLTCFR